MGDISAAGQPPVKARAEPLMAAGAFSRLKLKPDSDVEGNWSAGVRDTVHVSCADHNGHGGIPPTRRAIKHLHRC